MKYYTLATNQIDRMNELHYIPMKSITKQVAKYFVLDFDDILSESRHGHNVLARNFTIYFIDIYLKNRISKESTRNRVIGKFLCRDRNTILHHKKNIKFYIKNNIHYKHHHFGLNIILREHEYI